MRNRKKNDIRPKENKRKMFDTNPMTLIIILL